MTVIAWDGKTLAADKLAVNGSTRTTTTKIFRCDSGLLGVTGDLAIGMEMIDWFKGGAQADRFPASNRKLDEGCSLIHVRADGQVWKYESSLFPFRLEGEFVAFGSGEESAYVAMACGLDARCAVQMAIRFNIHCGNGIDTLELE